MTNDASETSPRAGTPAAARDQVFREAQSVADFSFGEKVASVFDDMLDRSVPFKWYHFCGIIALK